MIYLVYMEKIDFSCYTCKQSHPNVRYYLTVVSKLGKKYYRCADCNLKYCKAYRTTPQGATKMREAVNRSITKHPEKQKARMRIAYQIKTGRMVRPTKCERCNYVCKPHAHHDDYSKPLDVTWLCITCHTIVHTHV